MNINKCYDRVSLGGVEASRVYSVQCSLGFGFYHIPLLKAKARKGA